MCSNHYIPQTYAEVRRNGELGLDSKTNEQREAERQVQLSLNGRPISTGQLTVAILDWVVEVESGTRCWYCGKPKELDEKSNP